MPKFVKNRASGQSHPVAEGGLPAIQWHLYAGDHHLLLPGCETTCYQKVPLCYKDITSKHIFTSKGGKKEEKDYTRAILRAVCFLTTPNYIWVPHIELSPDCFQDKPCVKMSIFALNPFQTVGSYSWTSTFLWCSVLLINACAPARVFCKRTIFLTVSICAQPVLISSSSSFINYVG